MAFKFRTKVRQVTLGIDKKYKTDITQKLSKNTLQTEDYDELCRAIINRGPTNEKSLPGMFVGWDNTPRRGNRGRVCLNSSPEKFEYYLKEQIMTAKDLYNKDMLFLFDWNDWAEGGYLEPDQSYGYGYLEVISIPLKACGEFSSDEKL